MSHPPQPPQSGPVNPNPAQQDPVYPGQQPVYPGQQPVYPGQQPQQSQQPPQYPQQPQHPAGQQSAEHTGPQPSQPAGQQSAEHTGQGPAEHTGPQTQQQPNAAEMAAQFSARASALGLGNPLPAVAASMAGYITAVVASAITLVSLLIAAMIGAEPSGASSGSFSISSIDPSDLGAGWVLLTLPFHLAAMGGLGVFSGGEENVAQFSLLLVPLLPFLGLVLGSFAGGRIIQRLSSRPSLLHIWLSSLLGGFLVAILGTAIPFIFALREDGARVDASGVATFFGLWFIVSLCVTVGQGSGAQRPRWWAAVSELFVAYKAALLHGVILAVLGLVALVLSGLIAGELEIKQIAAGLFLLPLFGSLAGGLVISMLSLSGISVKGGAGSIVGSGTVTLADAPWYVILLSLAVGIVALLLVSLLWSRGRFTVPGNAASIVTSWVALPVAYFVSALGLMFVGRIVFDFSVQSVFIGDVGFSAGIPAWFPLLAFFWGLVVELIARFAVPFVLPFLPPVLTDWFRANLLTRSFAPAPDGALEATRPLEGVDFSRIRALAEGAQNSFGGGGTSGAQSAPGAHSASEASSAAGAGSVAAAGTGSHPEQPVTGVSPIAPHQPVPPVNSANPTGPMYPGRPPVQPGQPAVPEQGLARPNQPSATGQQEPPAPPAYPGSGTQPWAPSGDQELR